MTLHTMGHEQRALFLASLCKLTYSDQAPAEADQQLGIEAKALDFEWLANGRLVGLRGLLAMTRDDLVLALRGTVAATDSVPQLLVTLANWIINLAADQEPGYGGQVHVGFARAAETLWERLRTKVVARQQRRGPRRLWITGHSLGGALATLLAARFVADGQPVAAVYTFGAPRIGDRAFAEAYTPLLFRFENKNDVLPLLLPPADTMPFGFKALLQTAAQQLFDLTLPDGVFNYRHTGQCQFLDWDGTFRDISPTLHLRRTSLVADGIADHGIESYIASLGNVARSAAAPAARAAPEPIPFFTGELGQGGTLALPRPLILEGGQRHELLVIADTPGAVFQLSVHADPHPQKPAVAQTRSAGAGPCIVAPAPQPPHAAHWLRVACAAGQGRFHLYHRRLDAAA